MILPLGFMPLLHAARVKVHSWFLNMRASLSLSLDVTNSLLSSAGAVSVRDAFSENLYLGFLELKPR